MRVKDCSPYTVEDSMDGIRHLASGPIAVCGHYFHWGSEAFMGIEKITCGKCAVEVFRIRLQGIEAITRGEGQ